MLIELSKFSDKLRQYRLILEKLTAEQQDNQRRRDRLSKLSQRRRSSRKPDVAECYMCNANIELESTDSFATCRGCERLVCRGENCCQWVESIGIWECTGCQSNRVIQQKAGEWLLNQLTARLQQPGPVKLKDGNLLGLGLDSDDARSTTSSTVSANQRIKVREFIEELLSSMLHGPLDDVSVGQLMKHESYLPLWEGQQQHHSPSDQHFELKRLIQKILEEIGKLPELLNHSGIPLRPEEHLPYFDPKKYEQLVATAVLNKVVDDYRNPKNFPNAGDVAAKAYVGGGGGAVDLNHNQLTEGGGSHHTGVLNAEALRQMSVTADDLHAHEAASYSAADDRRLSDTDESYLSDYIQRHKVPLPDLSDTTTGSGSGAEDDDLQSLKSNATDGTWEENWLFRKRQLKTTESSIAMLVPSPTEEVKALIGDKNADEISDLSEAGSDCEGYESDSNVAPVGGVTAGDLNPSAAARSSSKDETSEGVSSSSKPQDSLEEEHFPADSLVSISSLPGNEEPLSEAKNSQLVAEQERSAGGGKDPPSAAGGSLIEDLISIEPVAEKVETTNPTLASPFFSDPFEVNNSVITDDVKLLQRTEASDNRSTTAEPCTNGHGDRKEVPIDRADEQPPPEQQQQQPHTHSNICPSSPVVEPVVAGRSAEDRPASSDVVADSANGSGARETNLTNNAIAGENTNEPARLNTPVPPLLLLLDSLSPPGSPVQQVLSPHPIMMTITDVFDRMAAGAPLAAISEELPPAAMLLDAGDSEPVGATPMDSFDQYSSPLTTISEELPPAGDSEAVPLIDVTAAAAGGGPEEESLASLEFPEIDPELEESSSEELPSKVIAVRSDEAIPLADTSEELTPTVEMEKSYQSVPLDDTAPGGMAEEAIRSPVDSKNDPIDSISEELPLPVADETTEVGIPSPVDSKNDPKQIELTSEELQPTVATETSDDDVLLVDTAPEATAEIALPSAVHSKNDPKAIESTSEELTVATETGDDDAPLVESAPGENAEVVLNSPVDLKNDLKQIESSSEEHPPTVVLETGDDDVSLEAEEAFPSKEGSKKDLKQMESALEELPKGTGNDVVSLVDTPSDETTEAATPPRVDSRTDPIDSASEELPPTVATETDDDAGPLVDTTSDETTEVALTSPVESKNDPKQIESISEELPPDCTSTGDVASVDTSLGKMPGESMPAPMQEPVESAQELVSTSTEDVFLVGQAEELATSPAPADDDQEPVEPVHTTTEAVLSPMDSFQDDSEYRTVSEATNNSLILVESFEELDPFCVSDLPQEPQSLQQFEDEFSSLVEQSASDSAEMEGKQESSVAEHPSPDLLQVRETPPAALYVRNEEQIEFTQQLPTDELCGKETSKRNPFEDEEGNADKPPQITLHADLVTFDNNAPSPERNPGIAAVTQQMRAYCEELKGILNRPSPRGEVEQETKPIEEESEPWEMVEPPEALEALVAFGGEMKQAAEDPTVSEVRPCKDHPIREEPLPELEEPFPSVLEIGNVRMAEYGESLKNIECVEEAIAMDEQVQVLPDATLEMDEGTSEAFSVVSPEPSHHIVAVNCTPSAEDPPAQITGEQDIPSIADEATESSQESFAPQSTDEETLLASLESRSESKIDDTSMPFSDSDLPSLSSPFTGTTGNVTNTTTTTTTAINNCMPTNITDQVTTPSISTSTIDTDTNPSNNTRFGSDLSVDAPPPSPSFVADCSIIPAQSTAEQQAAVSNGGHPAPPPPTDAGVDEPNEQSLDDADTLIPGSIAEREHLKWRNAKPIANNPYSPDALQRRLSEKSRPSSMIELERLVKKDAAPNGSAVLLLDDDDRPKEPVDSGTENDRSLQTVMGGGLSEKKKIGREYYINDPERLRAGGGVVKQTLGMEQKQQQQQHQQLSHSTDDEKSLLLGRNVDNDGDPNQLQVATVPTGSSLSRSSSFGKPPDPNAENIFAARPIQVTADDPILRKGTKVNYLSTAARDIFLVPLEQEPSHASLVSSSSEVSINSPSSSGARPELDSLTYSEDSDVTRIYDLTTGEAKVIRSGVPGTPAGDTILQILPQQASTPVNRPSASPGPVPASPSPDERAFLRPGPFPVKPLSPETIKFFAPKRKLSFTGSSSNLTASAGPAQPMHSSLHIDFPATRAATGSEFSIIEKDVIDVLPSVKELAKCYSGSCSEVSSMPPKPLYKPRDFLRQSSDVLNEDGAGSMPDAGTKGQRQYSSTSSIAVRDEIREIRKINLDAYRQQSTFYPMAPGHSITARSLSKQIREHKTNVTDDHKVGQHEELPGSNGRNGGGGGGGNAGDGDGGGGEGEVNAGHASPDRPSSPVFLPGHLKSSIEFFESLRNNP